MKIGISKIISIIQILLGTFLLTREIYHLIILPSEKEDIMGGLVTLYKYKENTYSLIFLWILLLMTGISYWLNKKINWTLNQIFLITLMGIIVFPFLTTDLLLSNGLTLFYAIIIILILLGGLILLNQPKNLKEISINMKDRILTVFLGILSVVIYWIIK